MGLDAFFKPKSVAVIGASRESRKFGHVIFKNFVGSEFEGKTYPVNPKAESILGFKVYPSLKEIPDEVDLAVIAVPAAIVPNTVDECLSKNVKASVIISGGFKEASEKGAKLERENKRKNRWKQPQNHRSKLHRRLRPLQPRRHFVLANIQTKTPKTRFNSLHNTKRRIRLRSFGLGLISRHWH